MARALKRALGMCFSPNAEWAAVSGEPARPFLLLTRFVLPLSCIPAACWALGLYFFGQARFPGDASGGGAIAPVVKLAVVAFVSSIVSVLLLSLALALIAPLFGRPRAFALALQVATYSSIPVLLAGVILVIPNLAFALMVAALHSCYLLYGGVHHVLGVKAENSAEYVALVMMLFLVASSLLGAFGGSTGLI